MSKLIELRTKQAGIVAQARERLDLINANTDESRAAELEASHDAAMAEFDTIQKQIEREERVERAEAALSEREKRAREQRRPHGQDVTDEGDKGDAEKPTYRSAFYSLLRNMGDVGAMSGEERSILRAGFVAGDKEQRAQSTTAAAGGYTVPTELAGFIDKALKDWGPMYDEDICTVISTAAGNAFKIPTVDDTAKGAGLHTEAAALTDDGGEDVVFGQKSLDAYVYDTEWIRWSFELSQDSIFNMESLLGALLGERLGREANNILTVGTGSSQPNGIVTASTLGKTAVSATAIAADELIDLQHSVNAAYRRSPKCRWMFADTTMQAIRKLKDGQGNYLWQMGDVKVGQPDLLLGKPYSINDDMAAIATAAKTVLFGDFSRYYVRKVGAPMIGVVRERFWPDLGIAGLVRLDGEIGQGAAVKHLIQA